MSEVVWDQIPTRVLVRVYHYLEDVDRVRASSTCRHWRNVFFDPSLWRVRTFSLRHISNHSEKMDPHYIKQLGRHLQSLKIQGNAEIFQYSLHKCEMAYIDNLLTAFNSLGNEKPQLHTFMLTDLLCHECWNAEKEIDSVMANLQEIFQGQEHLRELSLKCVGFGEQMDAAILQCLGQSRIAETLEILDVLDFSSLGKKIRRELSSCFNQCKQLKEIRLNYSYLGRGFDQEVWGSLKSSLRLLVVYSEYEEDKISEDGDLLSSDWWRQTCLHIPELKVHFHFNDTEEDASDKLVPEVPLVEIVWKENGHDSWMENSKMGNLLLYHLAHTFQHSLEAATLSGSNSETSRVNKAAVLSVWTQCKNLRKLEFGSNLVTDRMLEELRVEARIKHGLDPSVISLM